MVTRARVDASRRRSAAVMAPSAGPSRVYVGSAFRRTVDGLSTFGRPVGACARDVAESEETPRPRSVSAIAVRASSELSCPSATSRRRAVLSASAALAADVPDKARAAARST